MKYIQPLLLLLLLFLSSGCGSAKHYSYPTTKDNLEKAVLKVINTNPNIVVDTTQKVLVRRNPDNPNDTTTVIIHLSDFHSPADSAWVAAWNKAITRIKIKVGEIENDYQFRYLGGEQSWKSSTSSGIFLLKATDKTGNSIHRGETSLFEKEVVSKIDKELNLKHVID